MAPLGSILSTVFSASPAALLASQRRVEAAAASPSTPPGLAAVSGDLRLEEAELDRALRSLQLQLSDNGDGGRAMDGFMEAAQRSLNPVVPSLRLQLHFLLSFTFTASSSCVVSWAHRELSSQSRQRNLRLILALHFLVDRFHVEQRSPPPPLLAALSGCLPPLCDLLESIASQQATVLTTAASHLLFSLLHFAAPLPSLPPSFSSALRSLASGFRLARPLLASVLAALSSLPLPTLTRASSAAQSSLFLALRSSVQPPSSEVPSHRLTAALQPLSSFQAGKEGQPLPSDLFLAILSLSATLAEVQSAEGWSRVWPQFRLDDLRVLLSAWTAPRDDYRKVVRSLVRVLLAAYIAAIAPREHDEDAPNSEPRVAVTTADTGQGGCGQVLELYRVAVSNRRPLPSSLLRFLTAQLLQHPPLLSHLPALLKGEWLESDSASVSANSASLLYRLYSQQRCAHLLLPPLLAAYPRSAVDLTPLFTALLSSSTIPPLISRLLPDAGVPVSLTLPLLDAVIAAADDQVAAVLLVIDCFHDFLPSSPCPLPHPGCVSLSATARPPLSAELRSHLFRLLDAALSLPVFASPGECQTAVDRLFRHLASCPSSSLHLSIVTHLQPFLEGSPLAREAVLRFCADSLEQSTHVDLRHRRLDSASLEQIRSSLLFAQLFPVLVLRSLYSPLFTSGTAVGLQPRLLVTLMEALSSHDSAQLKTVAVEVVARLNPLVVLPAMLRAITPVSTFVLSSAFAFYAGLTQSASAERLMHRRLLFRFDPAQLTASLQASPPSLEGPETAAEAGSLVPRAVEALMLALQRSSAGGSESADARLQHGLVDALSNAVVASSSFHRTDWTAPSLLTLFLLPFNTARYEEQKEEQSEEKEGGTSAAVSQCSPYPLTVRLAVLQVLAYSLSRFGALQLRAKEEPRRDASEERWLNGLLDDWTTACLQSLVPYFALSPSGEERLLLLRLLFTAAYQRPSLAKQYGRPLMAIVRQALSPHPQVREVEEETGRAEVAAEVLEREEEGDARLLQLGALKLLGALLAHSADSAVEGEPRLLVDLRSSLLAIAKVRSGNHEAAELATQLLTLSGLA